MHKVLINSSIIILLSISNYAIAATPTETLKLAVNQLIAVASSKANDQTKRNNLAQIIKAEVDFDAVSKRVVSKSWKKSTPEQQQQFKGQFMDVMVNTYFVLLKNYSNEEVLFSKEQIKKDKYAIVDTQIISGNKKIPVRYRMIKVNDSWKIYDFIPEGVSLITTYKNSYNRILKKSGMSGLLEEMKKRKTTKKETEKAKAKE